MARRLSIHEQFDLLSRDSDLGELVALHERAVLNGQWSQIRTAENYDQLLAIPTYGLVFDDAVYGRGVVFPAANGVLWFVADIPTSVLTEIQKGTYSEPSGNSLEQLFADLKSGFESVVTIATAVLGFVILKEIFK